MTRLELDTIEHRDYLQWCEGCGQLRHKNWFVVGRKYCHECREAQGFRLTEALRSGSASEAEILSQATTPDIIIPGGLLVYTMKDDTPTPSARDLNNQLAEAQLTALTYAKNTRKLTHEEYQAALVPLTEDPVWVEAYEQFARETPDPRLPSTKTVSVGRQGRLPRSRPPRQAAGSPRRGTRTPVPKVGE